MSADPVAIIYYGLPLPTNEYGEKTEDTDIDSLVRDWGKENPKHIDYGLYGYEGNLCYYIYSHKKKLSVEWDEQLCLAGYDFSPQPECDKVLKAFCDKYNIPFQQPAWHLACLYF